MNETTTQPKADWTPLASAIRDKAKELDEYRQDESIDQGVRDEMYDYMLLLDALARMVEGNTVYKSFGAPGYWGYSTPIGAALQKCYRQPGSAL